MIRCPLGKYKYKRYVGLTEQECRVCHTIKPYEGFKKSKAFSVGRRSECIECKREQSKEYRRQNKERVLEYSRQKYAADKESHRFRCKRWSEMNQDKIKENNARWYRENKHKCFAHSAKYRAAKLSAAPNWDSELNEFVIQEAYAISQLNSKLTGVDHHVDHIIPLQGKLVCGLHWYQNLQVIPAKLNRMKSNKV